MIAGNCSGVNTTGLPRSSPFTLYGTGIEYIGNDRVVGFPYGDYVAGAGITVWNPYNSTSYQSVQLRVRSFALGPEGRC
jgi:hypothetical protein